MAQGILFPSQILTKM